MNRESVASAVFDRLASLDGIRTSGRKPKSFDAITPSECPALFLGVGSSQSIGKAGPRALWRLEFLAYLYVHDGSKEGPSSQLNEFLGKIEDSFRATQDELEYPGTSPDTTTLGGLAIYARPTSVQTDEGSFGDQGVAVVTIEVVTAG